MNKTNANHKKNKFENAHETSLDEYFSNKNIFEESKK